MKRQGPGFWLVLRLLMGWLFLWPFLDKLLGLGFATPRESAWIAGGSPTAGFLGFATRGPLAPVFQGLAGSPVVDWLFMLGLLATGVSLLLGLAVPIGAMAGALMMVLMWLSRLPPENNPFVDEHIIYIVILIGLARVGAGEWMGLDVWLSQRMRERRPLD
jgi:thiosulfate dehydrogenase [quinone] large subunit